jgi:hypothetical protein
MDSILAKKRSLRALDVLAFLMKRFPSERERTDGPAERGPDSGLDVGEEEIQPINEGSRSKKLSA